MSIKYVLALMIFLGTTAWLTFQNLSLMHELKDAESMMRTQSQDIKNLTQTVVDLKTQNATIAQKAEDLQMNQTQNHARAEIQAQLAAETVVLNQMLENLASLKAKNHDPQIASLQEAANGKRRILDDLKKQLADLKQLGQLDQEENQTANLQDKRNKQDRDRQINEQIVAQELVIQGLNQNLTELKKQRRSDSLNTQVLDAQTHQQAAKSQLNTLRLQQKQLSLDYNNSLDKSRSGLREDEQNRHLNERKLNQQIQDESTALKKIETDIQSRTQALHLDQAATTAEQKQIDTQKAKITALQNRLH